MLDIGIINVYSSWNELRETAWTHEPAWGFPPETVTGDRHGRPPPGPPPGPWQIPTSANIYQRQPEEFVRTINLWPVPDTEEIRYCDQFDCSGGTKWVPMTYYSVDRNGNTQTSTRWISQPCSRCSGSGKLRYFYQIEIYHIGNAQLRLLG